MKLLSFRKSKPYSTRLVWLSMVLICSCILQTSAQTNCVPPPTGLVGWWPGDGSATNLVGTNHGLLLNGATFAAGQVEQSFLLDGINDAITNSAPGLSNILNSYTMEFWAWPTASRASTPETTSGISGTENQRYAIFPHNGRFGPAGSGVSVGTNGVSVFEHGSAYLPSLLVYDAAISGWTHVAVVYSNQQPRLYLNGTLVRTGLASSRSSYPSTSLGDGENVGYGFYGGLLDEVSVYNRPLTGVEILSIYNAGSSGKCKPGMPPTILSHPTNQTVSVGGTALFTVIASGSLPLSYQWRFQGTNLPGATSSSLTLTNVQALQAGTYAVHLTNAFGSAVSSNAVLSVSLPCTGPPPQLISWWPGEGNSLDIISTNHASLFNGAGFTNGVVGSAFNFDGADDIMIVSNSASLNFGPNADFSIEGWVRAFPHPTTFDLTVFVDKRENEFRGYEFGLAGGRLHFRFSDSTDSGSAFTSPGSDLRDGNWHHVGLTVARTSITGIKFYVDGLLTGTFDATSQPGDLTNPAHWAVGQHSNPGINAALKGMLDEWSIYNRSLSGAEISAIYSTGSGKCKTPSPPFIVNHPTNQTLYVGGTATFTVLAGGSLPLGYQWKWYATNLPGANGSTLTLTNVQLTHTGSYSVTVTNSLGAANSLNATLTVIPRPGCTNPPAGLIGWWRGESNAVDQISGNDGALSGGATFAIGRVGSAFGLNGNGAVVQVTNAPNLQLQDFTIEAWVRRGSASQVSLNGNGNGHIFGYGTGGYSLSLNAGGFLSLSKVGSSQVMANTAITDTNFHHVAVTKAGSAVLFYLDGTPELAGSFDPGFAFTTPVYIGGIGTNFSFLGTIDEPSIYGRALSSQEINAIYDVDSSGKCVVPMAPFLITHPLTQSVVLGGNVTFTALAAGTLPLNYQWRLNGAPIQGATSNVLVLPTVQLNQAGEYSVRVTNFVGASTSSNALLTVTFPPAAIRIVSTNGAAGAPVSVFVTLAANGNENAMGFSLNFDTARLTFASVTVGNGAPGGVAIINTSVTNLGRLGIGLTLPPGTTFNAGTQEVVRVNFVANVITVPAISTISFGDQPTLRQLLGTQLNTLPATYSSGTITISPAVGFEGDVFPRPNGDLSTGLADWLMLGRYAARLEYPTNASEFQRADGAPRATKGDGAIKVSDWVQTGRYASGLEPLTPIGGPTNEIANPGPAPSANRLLTAGAMTLLPGQLGVIPISLSAQGNENAAGFTLSFNPNLVNFSNATLGNGAAGAILYLNTNQLALGRAGITLALAVGTSFAPGVKELVQVTFSAVGGAGSFSLGFTDLQVLREVSDPAGNALAVSFQNGTVLVDALPYLNILKTGSNIRLSWPLSATNFFPQQAQALGVPGLWTNLPDTPGIAGDEKFLILPLSTTNMFYRLYRP